MPSKFCLLLADSDMFMLAGVVAEFLSDYEPMQQSHQPQFLPHGWFKALGTRLVLAFY